MKSLGDIGHGEAVCFVVATGTLIVSLGLLPAVGFLALAIFVRMK